MEVDQFQKLIKALLEGKIDRSEYNKLFSYIAGIVKKKAGGNFTYEEIQEIALDFIVKLLSNRAKFEPLLDDPISLKRYVVTAIKNFVLDRIKDMKSKNIEVVETAVEYEEEDKKGSFIERQEDPSSVRVYELRELRYFFTKRVKPDEVKYFCYLLDSKRYKCLWGNKSDDAIYKDVSRKRKIVEDFGRELQKLGVEEELIRDFIKIVLSDICEEIRSKLCDEARGEKSI